MADTVGEALPVDFGCCLKVEEVPLMLGERWGGDFLPVSAEDYRMMRSAR